MLILNLDENIKFKISRQDSGWRFDKIISMIIYFNKAIEMNGSSYVKIPSRSSAI